MRSPRLPVWTKKTKAKASVLQQAGKSIREIARHLHIAQYRVRDMMIMPQQVWSLAEPED
jgi:hypothetical protein